MTSALLIGRNRESATMTSACLLEEAMSSKDDVNSRLQYIQQSTRSARAISAMMTSAVMSSRSAVDKKRKSYINNDDVSSDVITISSRQEAQELYQQ
ncbi:hypothetical protein F511_34844 [Dorcoceras hygrometricum]|uniref:Uncharacterized protein n=1 Tax=Dorcoceras hygrometricum TaxID=472368 RepID=A0A2Z7CDY4_9LAMI|nr:hypothetical protein F511_34844 [Dorcoceras hygrometricum]